MLRVTNIRIGQGQYRWNGLSGATLPMGEVEVDWQDDASGLRRGTLKVDLSGAPQDAPLVYELRRFISALEIWLTTQIHETPA